MARTHVVIADEVVDAMDRLVGARGRSRFLEEAAREKLARLELEAALEETANTVSSARHPEWRSRRRPWPGCARRDGRKHPESVPARHHRADCAPSRRPRGR